MTEQPPNLSLDVAGDWGAITDQLRAHARTITADDDPGSRWIRGQATIIRQDLARALPHVPPDLLAEVIVRAGGMLGDIAMVVDSSPATTRAIGAAQTVMSHALFGSPEDGDR